MKPLPVLDSNSRPVGTPARRARRSDAVRAVMLRVYRLAVVVAIVWLIHRHHARLRIDGDAPIAIHEVRAFFPTAAGLTTDESERMGLFVSDVNGSRIGYVLRTSPIADKIIGYSGPTDTLVALDPAMRVVGIRIRSSADTKGHVRDVAGDAYFMKLWAGKTWDQVAGVTPEQAHIEGVSGASLTSMCIAHGIHERFRQVTASAAATRGAGHRVHWRAHDTAMVVVAVLATLFSFTHLRGRPWLRMSYQVALIGYVGFWNGQLIAQSLLAGWAASTVPWQLAPGLVLLVAASLLVPWSSRRALYCSQVCPHGAAQELLHRVLPGKLSVSRRLHGKLRWLPLMLLALVLIVAMLRLPTDLAAIEPFDAYLVRSAGMPTIVVAVLGLAASLVVPMAYCKYGCPTGMLLGFVRSHGRADRFGRRDVAAGLLVLLTVGLYLGYDRLHHWIVG